MEPETDQVEEWYGTKYVTKDFDQSLLDKITYPKCEFKKKAKLDLPPPNNLVPKNFDILAKNAELSK